MPILKDYWDALDRLKCNEPILRPKGSKINNDNVALEAGRKRGSIKKSRESFSELIIAIERAAKDLEKKRPSLNAKIKNERSQKLHLQRVISQGLKPRTDVNRKAGPIRETVKTLW